MLLYGFSVIAQLSLAMSCVQVSLTTSESGVRFHGVKEHGILINSLKTVFPDLLKFGTEPKNCALKVFETT